MCPCIRLRFAIALVATVGFSTSLMTCAYAQEIPRYSVIRFEGEVRLPAGSQFSETEPPGKLPPESISTPALHIIVADIDLNEVWQFARMSLWHMGNGKISKEHDVQYHVTSSGVTLNFDGNQSRLKDQNSMWVLSNTTLFVEPFGLEVGTVTTLVDSIARACREGSIRHEPSTEIVSESLYRRIPTVEGKGLIFNHFRSGKIVSASWFEAGTEANRFDLISSVVYVNEKPFEIRRGILSLSSQEDLPIEISEFLNAAKPAAVIRPEPTDDLGNARGDSKLRTQKSFGTTILCSASIASFFLVLVSQFFVGGRKNEKVS